MDYEILQRPELAGVGAGAMEYQGSVVSDWAGGDSRGWFKTKWRWGGKMLISDRVPWVEVLKGGPGEG